MNRTTVLKRTDRDWKTLPLGVRDAFVITQLDGRLTIEQVSEIVGLDTDELIEIAERLVEIGAAANIEKSERPAWTPRRDPRAEEDDDAPPPPRRSKRPSRAPAPIPRRSMSPKSMSPKSMLPKSMSPKSMSPKSMSPKRSPSPNPSPRRTRRSLKAHTAVKPQAIGRNEGPCELDQATQSTIIDLDTKLPRLDHYAKLGVERDAEKKTIKRAYFAYVAKYHPDRFFGKKLGAIGAAIDRVFHLLTEAHDTLIDPMLRVQYDAKLPRPPEKKGSKAAIAAQRTSLTPRKGSKGAMPAMTVSRKMEVALAPTITPPPRMSIKPDSKGASMKPPKGSTIKPPKGASIKPPKGASIKPGARGGSLKPPKGASMKPGSKGASMKPPSETQDGDRLRRLVATARDIKVHQRVEMFVKAAEEAFAAGDVINAANNYRLALEHREDTYIRNKLDDVEVLAKAARFDKAMARARGAERDKKWADAAIGYERAFEAKPDPTAAERAAHAILAAGGDLARAKELAARAVSMRSRVADYRVTYAQVLYTLEDYDAAEEQIEEAVDLAPKDARVKELSKMIAKKIKEKY